MRRGGWGVKQRPSPYGPGGETGYTAQEDLKSISRHTMGEGRMVRAGPPFLRSLPLGLLCSSVLGSPPSSLSLFLGPILWPRLIPCSRLTTYFPSQAMGIWPQGKRGRWPLWLLQAVGASWGSRFPLPALCQGAFTERDESPWNDKAACFSVVWVLAREYSCQTISWRFVVF